MPDPSQQTNEMAYRNIARAVDAGPMTAPKADGDSSPAFLAYLALLYTPEEADIVQHLKMPVGLMSSLADLSESMRDADDLALACGKTAGQVTEVLDALVQTGRVIGLAGHYGLPPLPVLVNNHQFREQIEAGDTEAARLYQQFFIDEKFYRYYQSSEMETQVMRVIPVERTLRAEQKILDTEEAHKIIDAAAILSLVPCPCRTRTEKLGTRECKNETPVGFCIMMDNAAMYFQSTGRGRQVDAPEAKKYFDTMQDLGLVGITDNHQESARNIVCLCCRCCCSQVRGRTRWDHPEAIAPSNFVAESSDDCLMCAKCVERCVFEAIALDDAQSRAVVDAARCVGCGVCTITCDQEALRLVRLERETPLPSADALSRTIATENRGGGVQVR